uniref:Uncharacterized protein n=1 Tax=Fagus sylvatica TaxID=28930 RepID=A0A2N9FRI2_FAGSY
MESDLSLLEISGEDDSLLQESPSDDGSTLNNNNKNYFLCSPLQIHGSKRPGYPPRPLAPSIVEGKVGSEDTEKPSSSLQTESINKENIIVNKVEMPKLSMEPQQMKRKKKGGGYNLRKSLAWDRAFFTEEGVLNPSELSMISGSFSRVGGEMLSVISEEGRESLSGVSDGTRDTAGLQAIEENLFKELPTSSLIKDGKGGSRLLPKHGSPARDNVASASAGATLGANDSKRNQTAQQAVIVQRKTGSKASSESTKSRQNDPKSGPVHKPLTAGTSVRQARRNVVRPTSEKHPSTNLQRPLVTKANNSLEIIPDALLPSSNHTPDSHDGGGIKFPVTLPQNACKTGGHRKHVQLQTEKPSGLRMPSPSLGFFGQPRASSLHSPLQKSSQPFKLAVSNTPNLRKPGATNHIHDLRPPLHPGKLPNVVNNVTTGNMKGLGSSLGCSVPSTVNSATHNKQDEKMKSVLQMNNKQVEVKEQYDFKCFEAIKNQNQLDCILYDVNQQVLECAEPLKAEVIAHREESELQRASCGQLEKSDDNKKITDDLIDHQIVEDKPYSLETKNDCAFSGSNSGDTSCPSTQNTSKANDDCLSSAHDVKEKSGEQAELMKPFTCKDGKNFSESQMLWANNGSFLKDSGASEELQKFNCMEDVSPKIQGCSETEFQRSHGHSRFMYMEQAKYDPNKDDKMSRNSLGEDAQAQSLDGDMSDATGKSSLSTSTVDSQKLMVVDVNERIGEQLELCQSVEYVILEANDACESISESSSAHCLIPPAMQNCGPEVAKTVECQHVEDALSGSVSSKPVVENDNSSINTQFRHDVELHGQFSSLEVEMIGEDHTTGNGCPKSGDLCGSELENPHPACHLSPPVQVNGGSGIDDVIQREDVEEKKCNLSTKNSSAISESQPGDEIGGSHRDTSMVPIDLLSAFPFGKSQSFEGSMIFNSKTAADNSKVEGSGGSGLESPHGISQHKHVDQARKEIDGVNDMFKESHLVQSSNGKPLVDSFNSNVSILASNNQYLMVVDDVNDQSEHPEPPNLICIVEQVSLDNNHGLYLNDDLLLANPTSKELKKGSVLEEYDVYGSKSESSKLFSQITPALQGDGVDADQKAEYLHMGDAEKSSVSIVPLVENLECGTDIKSRHDNGLIGQASLKFDSSEKMSTDQIAGAVSTYNSKGFCSLGEESGLSVRTDHALESSNVLNSESLSDKAETDISQINEMQQELDELMSATEDKDATLQLSDGRRNSENDKKQDALVIKPPPHAVPFSDEWLAAFEAAGEVY